jgi:hypothetical protein
VARAKLRSLQYHFENQCRVEAQLPQNQGYKTRKPPTTTSAIDMASPLALNIAI